MFLKKDSKMTYIIAPPWSLGDLANMCLVFSFTADRSVHQHRTWGEGYIPPPQKKRYIYIHFFVHKKQQLYKSMY